MMTLSVNAPAAMARLAVIQARAGFRLLKIKLGGEAEGALDLERLRAIHAAAPRVRLALDANQALSPPALRRLLEGAAKGGIPVRFIEQPFPRGRWDLYRGYRPRGGCPLILDESVRTPSDARRALSACPSAGVNVKLAKSGLGGGKMIAELFRARRRRLMIGCMAESRVGMAAAVHFAMGLGVFDEVDLDSDLLLEPTPWRGGYVRRGPWILSLRRPRPGLGLFRP
jgi:L-alanine-DL-glutamate epimerase-like enolase superfamily enzyme